MKVHKAGKMFFDLTQEAQDRSLQVGEIYAHIMWIHFDDDKRETVSQMTGPPCGCEILEFEMHSPETKWIVWQKHELAFDHLPVYPCSECGILATASHLLVHLKFNCKDFKAQALHQKKPHHEVFDAIQGVLKKSMKTK